MKQLVIRDNKAYVQTITEIEVRESLNQLLLNNDRENISWIPSYFPPVHSLAINHRIGYKENIAYVVTEINCIPFPGGRLVPVDDANLKSGFYMDMATSQGIKPDFPIFFKPVENYKLFLVNTFTKSDELCGQKNVYLLGENKLLIPRFNNIHDHGKICIGDEGENRSEFLHMSVMEKLKYFLDLLETSPTNGDLQAVHNNKAFLSYNPDGTQKAHSSELYQRNFTEASSYIIQSLIEEPEAKGIKLL